MAEAKDNPNVVVRPPIAFAIAITAGFIVDWLVPLPWMPEGGSHRWIGAGIFVLGLALAAWAIVTFTRAGTNVQTTEPTTTIVANGPYRFTRNPIYLGMFLGLAGLAVAFDTLWLLMTLVVFALVLRYGVVAREELYLERKFGSGYLDYKSRVRRRF